MHRLNVHLVSDNPRYVKYIERGASRALGMGVRSASTPTRHTFEDQIDPPPPPTNRPRARRRRAHAPGQDFVKLTVGQVAQTQTPLAVWELKFLGSKFLAKNNLLRIRSRWKRAVRVPMLYVCYRRLGIGRGMAWRLAWMCVTFL